MKRLLYITLSVVLFASLSACSDDSKVNEVDLGYLKLESSNVNFTYVGGTGTIVAATTSTVTAVSADQTWCTVTVSANTVTVVALPNEELQGRSTSITVSADGRKIVVPVSQTSSSLAISTTTPLTFTAAASSQNVTFAAPDDAIVTGSSSETWATVEVTNSTKIARVTVTANTGANSRTATITLSTGNISKTFDIAQQDGRPVAAGTITESNVTATSVTLNIAAISLATTYRWYRNGVEVQNTSSRTYTATSSGIYTVEGVNSFGVGAASPNHQVLFASTYFGNYQFTVDYRNGSTAAITTGVTYADELIDATSAGYPGEMYFENAIDGGYYIDFEFLGPQISYIDYSYDYFGTGVYNMKFVPCILEGGYIYFVYDLELEFDLATGRLAFPTTLTHSSTGTKEAFYVIWAWNATTNASAGRVSTNFMFNVNADKIGYVPGVAPFNASATRSNIVKIPVRITPPAGFNSNTPVRADQMVTR